MEKIQILAAPTRESEMHLCGRGSEDKEERVAAATLQGAAELTQLPGNVDLARSCLPKATLAQFPLAHKFQSVHVFVVGRLLCRCSTATAYI